MPELNFHVLLTFVLYAAITGVLNLLLAERSRVDAWAESHPKLAALLKLLRGLGLDPWHLVAAASLFFKGKLPGGTGGQGGSGGAGGSGAVDPQPTRIRFERPNDYPPDEPAEIRKWRHPDWRYALGPVALIGAGLAALFVIACSAPLPDPCSRVSLATITAGCEVRIKAECEAGDESCPAYVECSKAVESWRGCR